MMGHFVLRRPLRYHRTKLGKKINLQGYNKNGISKKFLADAIAEQIIKDIKE